MANVRGTFIIMIAFARSLRLYA